VLGSAALEDRGAVGDLVTWFGERLAGKIVRAPEGDFRDWEAIREWAQGIASALAAPPQAGSSFKGGTIDVNTIVPGTAHS